MPFTQGHALIVGVGTYLHLPHWKVPKTVADADAIARVLQDPALAGYPDEQVIALTEYQATRQDILAALDTMAARVGENDMFLFFYSGHGDHDAQGNYYLTTYDTKVDNRRIVPGSALSQGEFLAKLRTIKAKKVVIVLNACFSGDIIEPGTLGDDEEPPLSGANPSEGEVKAMLGSGEGRVVITACKHDQRSYVGSGALTVFVDELVKALQGQGVRSRNGVISVFDLYTHLAYSIPESVQEASRVPAEVYARYGPQEPEITVIKAVGPFPVALWRGAQAPEDITLEGSLPPDLPVREVSKGEARSLFNQYVQIQNQTTITTGGSAVGRDVVAGGDFVGRDQKLADTISGGTAIGKVGDVQGGIGNTTSGDTISGGVKVTGNAGDIVSGGTKINQLIGDFVRGNKIEGDKVQGDKISVGSISGDSSVAIGRKASVVASYGGGGGSIDLTRIFAQIYRRIDSRHETQDVPNDDVRAEVQKIEAETRKGEQANTGRLARAFANLKDMDSTMFEVVVTALTAPNPVIATAVRQIAAKVRAD